MPKPSNNLSRVKITNKGPLDLARGAYNDLREILSYPASAVTALPAFLDPAYKEVNGKAVPTGKSAPARYQEARKADLASAKRGEGLEGIISDPANLIPAGVGGGLAKRAAAAVASQALVNTLEGRDQSLPGLAMAAMGGALPESKIITQGTRPASPVREGAVWAQHQLDGLLPLDQATLKMDPKVLAAYGIEAPALHVQSRLDPSVTWVPRNRAPGTEMGNAYAEWAGKRPLVSPSGQPLVLFHGTSDPSIALRDKGFRRYTGQSGAFLGAGSYFTPSPGDAETWAGLQAMSRGERGLLPHGQQIMPVHVATDNPLLIPFRNGEDQYNEYYKMLGIPPKVAAAAQSANKDAAAQISDALTSRGHDAAIRLGPMRSVVEAFLPNPEGRVKSIFNRGTWDRGNIDMLKAIPAAGAGLLYRATSQQKENQ